MDYSHLNNLTTYVPSHSMFEEMVKKLVKNNFNVTSVIYDKGKVINYFDYLFFLTCDSGMKKNIIHGKYGIDREDKVVLRSEFMKLLFDTIEKFDIYGNLIK